MTYGHELGLVLYFNNTSCLWIHVKLINDVLTTKNGPNNGGKLTTQNADVPTISPLATGLIPTTCKRSHETSVWNCFKFDVFALAPLEINLFENLVNVKSLKLTSIHYTSEIFLCFLPSLWEDATLQITSLPLVGRWFALLREDSFNFIRLWIIRLFNTFIIHNA